MQEQTNQATTKGYKLTYGKAFLNKIDTNNLRDLDKDGNKLNKIVTAEIQQVFTKSYPTKKVNNILIDSDEFGLDSQTFDSKRTVWMDFPASYTEEKIKSIIDSSTLHIRETLSSSPIITAEEEKLFNDGIITDEQWDNKINNQKVRNTAGEIVLDQNGNEIYYRRYACANYEADIDLRTNETVSISTPLTQPQSVTQTVSEGKEVKSF